MYNRSEPKVLIVDDETDICFLLTRILNKRSIKSECAGTIAEARKYIQTEAPQLVFLDNCLPDGQGMDFIPFIKESLPGTQVVVITANDSLVEIKKAFTQGADDFLSKPLSLARIYGSIDRMKPGGMSETFPAL